MQYRYKVLITSKLFGLITDEPVRLLEEAGCEIVRSALKHPIKSGQLATIIRDMDAVIVGNDTVDKEAIDAANRLKIICMHGSGLDAIDAEYARKKGIIVTNLPGGNSEAVAEFACGVMFGLSRRINEADRNLRGGSWSRHIGDEITGKRLGVIGLGSSGKAFALKAKSLGMEMVAFNRSHDAQFAEKNQVRYVGLVELLKSSDYVSLHVPLTKDTYHMIGKAELSLMKAGSYLINTARGGLVDEAALYEALKDRHLAGAALDVFEQEPVSEDSPLFTLPNCILTPHIASQSKERIRNNSIEAAKKVLSVLKAAARLEE
jgi:D-3-phosphoglycerate dehydrogenase